MEWDCSLTEQHREQVDQAIRDAITGGGTGSGTEGMSATDEAATADVYRYVPARIPGKEGPKFDVGALPELEQIEVNSAGQSRSLGLTAYLSGAPEDKTVTVDVVDFIESSLEAEPVEVGMPQTLDELGPEWERLAESLVARLAAFTDAPLPEDLPPGHSPPWTDDGPMPVATTAHDDGISFTTYVQYREEIEDIYVSGDRAAAERLGLPF